MEKNKIKCERIKEKAKGSKKTNKKEKVSKEATSDL